MGHQHLFATYGNPGIVVDGVDFDGTNDVLNRDGGLTGIADSQRGIFHVYARIDVFDSSNGHTWFEGTTAIGGAISRFFVGHGNSGPFIISAKDTGGTNILNIQTNNTYSASSTWRSVLASWDLSTGDEHLYINDVNDIIVVASTPGVNIDYTLGDWSVGGRPNGTNLFNGALAELYFAPGQYLDFSKVANRRKFISATGKPVHLGTTGALPTGTAPLVYHHLDDGDLVNNFSINRGTGGNFTITGILETASSSPSD